MANNKNLLPYLVQIAEKHLPQLEYDLDRASTLFTLQEAAKNMHQIVTYIVHHLVMEGRAAAQAALPPTAAAAPLPAPVRQTPVPGNNIPRPATAMTQSGLPPIRPGAGGLPPLPGMAASAPEQPRVMDVKITPQGTQVQVPGGPTIEIPPGEPVVVPEPVIMGPNDVVLPPGGGLGPEAEAALAAATGGARNITNELPPQE